MCKPLCVRVCVHAMTFHVCTSAFGMCYAKKDVRQVHDMSGNQCQLCLTLDFFCLVKTLCFHITSFCLQWREMEERDKIFLPHGPWISLALHAIVAVCEPL